jgi:hypothetical protein
MVAYPSSNAHTAPPSISPRVRAPSAVSPAPERVPTQARAEELQELAPTPQLRWRVLRWLIWGPAALVIISATVVTGGLVFFLLPLLAVLYGFVALIALLGPDDEVARREEERAKSWP